MKKLIYITFSVLLASCGIIKTEEVGGGDGKITPETQIYAQAFRERSIEYGSRPINLGKLGIRFNEKLSGTTTLGQCYMTSTGVAGQVEINPAFWNSKYTTVAMKEELIFHELGHCILNRNHDDAIINIDGYNLSRSVMSTYFLSTDYYLANYSAYMNELFKQVASSSYVLSSDSTTFPASYYANALTSPLIVGKVMSTKAIYSKDHVESDDPDEMYKDITKFGCEDHDHE